MASDPELAIVHGSIFARDAIKYGAFVFDASKADFAEMVVDTFYEQNRAEIRELGDTIIESPADHPAVLARIESEKASA